MKKKLLALLLTLCLVLGLFPMTVFAAVEENIHIVTFGDIKKVVKNYYDEDKNENVDLENIKIYSMKVHGMDKQGKPATVGGEIWAVVGDIGLQGTNGHLFSDDGWKVYDAALGNLNTINGVTIYAKVNEQEFPCKVDLDSWQYDKIDWNITEVNLKVNLSYDLNGGEGTLPERTAYVEHDLIDIANGEGLEKDLATFIGFSKTKPADVITTQAAQEAAGIIAGDFRIDQDTTLYAVWAEDKNGNDEPDYQETKYTVTYKDGVDGTVFKDEVHENLLVVEKNAGIQ